MIKGRVLPGAGIVQVRHLEVNCPSIPGAGNKALSPENAIFGFPIHAL
jgi:hypothetical protein